MRRTLAALALAVALWTGAAADEPSAAERLRRAYVTARDSGRLARLAGEHRLRCGAVTERVRIAVEAGGLFVESTCTDPADQDSIFGSQRSETVSLDAEGRVTSFSTSWVGTEHTWQVTAWPQGDRARVGPTGFAEEEEKTHWSDEHLPDLVPALLWPLLVDEGTLRCERQTLSPIPTDPLGGMSASRWSVLCGASTSSVATVGTVVVATIEESDGCGTRTRTVLVRDATGRLLSRRATWERRDWFGKDPPDLERGAREWLPD